MKTSNLNESQVIFLDYTLFNFLNLIQPERKMYHFNNKRYKIKIRQTGLLDRNYSNSPRNLSKDSNVGPNVSPDKSSIQISTNILINSHDSFNSTSHTTPYISGNTTDNVGSMDSSIQVEDRKSNNNGKNITQINQTYRIKKAIMNNINDSLQQLDDEKKKSLNANSTSSTSLSLNNTNQIINHNKNNTIIQNSSNNIAQAIQITLIKNDNQSIQEKNYNTDKLMMSRMDWIMNLKNIFNDSKKSIKEKSVNLKLFLQNINQKSQVISNRKYNIYFNNFRVYLYKIKNHIMNVMMKMESL